MLIGLVARQPENPRREVVSPFCHTINTWSKTQSFIALSSGESELYAAMRAAAETMAKDFGWELCAEVYGDASAALGIIHRQGLGKTRHIQTGLLWVQQIAAEQRLKFGKVWGKENPADHFTKHLDEPGSLKHTATLKFDFTTGRAIDAANLLILSQSWHEVISGGKFQEWRWLQFITNGRKVARLQGSLEKFPLQDVSQVSSTTFSSSKNKCDSWLSPCRAQSNLVSQSDGRKDTEVNIGRNYSPVSGESIVRRQLPQECTGKHRNSNTGEYRATSKNAPFGVSQFARLALDFATTITRLSHINSCKTVEGRNNL